MIAALSEGGGAGPMRGAHVDQIMVVTVADAVGVAGVALIVATYFLSQIGRMDSRAPAYPALNAVGAVLILYSLAFTFNLASFVIEVFWLGISVVGLFLALRRRAREK